MRIALLGPLDSPIAEPFRGGLERHTAQLARGLADLGHQVTLFGHPDSRPPANVMLQPCADHYRKAVGKIRAGNFDILHNNTTRGLPSLLSPRLGLPVVTTLHTPPYRGIATFAILARLVSRHRFVAISDFTARQWRPYTGASSTVYNGIQPEDWPYAESGTERLAVWAGRIVPDKGLTYAIEAAKLAGYRLEIAGALHDEGYFEQAIRPLLSENIIYRGHLQGEELARLIGRAELGLFTSVWDEPFGLVLTEMLACGTPVAGFDSGAAGEIVTEEVGVLVPKRDVPALADAIRSASGKSRAACRSRAVDNFRVGRMVKAYAALYRDMIGPGQ